MNLGKEKKYRFSILLPFTDFPSQVFQGWPRAPHEPDKLADLYMATHSKDLKRELDHSGGHHSSGYPSAAMAPLGPQLRTARFGRGLR